MYGRKLASLQMLLILVATIQKARHCAKKIFMAPRTLFTTAAGPCRISLVATKMKKPMKMLRV